MVYWFKAKDNPPFLSSKILKDEAKSPPGRMKEAKWPGQQAQATVLVHLERLALLANNKL